MPNIIVRLPDGVLDAGAKQQLASLLNTCAADAEQLADDPRSRALCWVVVDEVRPGNWTCGGVDMTAQAVPVIVQVFVPAGVLDGAARARYATGIYHAVHQALPAGERMALVSSIFTEVPDGYWGVNDSVWHLAEFARQAGYRHLPAMTPAASVRP